MARPKFPRFVGFLPGTTYFKPAGVPMLDLEEVIIGRDEIEALRLKNIQGLSQEEAAGQMAVSQSTFHRLLSSACEKVTDAIVNGKALRIEGGTITVPETFPPSQGKGRRCAGGRRGRAGISRNHEGGSMKIAITSIDGSPEGMVDERFGRARQILVYDVETGKYEAAENSKQMNLAEGAGIQTAQNVVNLGVSAVISGHLGPKAYHVLKTAGVDVYTAVNMTVAEAVRQYREGTLGRLLGADVEGHGKRKGGSIMPGGDGTGPRGMGGRGAGCGRPSGSAVGRQGARGAGRGPAREVICPNCGERMPHQLGIPCFQQKCPKCGSAMVRA
jgi:predicted DNA-binding protein (UPF0251 family)/predicted Fe-Mo cluster-binding NifX family protein